MYDVIMSSTTSSPEALICFDCGNFYKTEDEFSSHLSSCVADDDEEVTVTVESPKETVEKNTPAVPKPRPTKKLCPIRYCNKSVKKLENHITRVHGDKCFPCSHCDFVGDLPKEIQMHMKRMHMVGVRKVKSRCFPCTDCDFVGNLSKDIQRHIKQMHPKVVKRIKRRGNKEKLGCDYCGFSTYLEESLKHHEIEMHGKTVCTTCKYLFDDSMSYLTHFETNRISCHECGTLIMEKGFARHLKLMHGDQPITMEKCSICGKILKAMHLNGHMKKVHGEKNLACPHCEFRAGSKHDMIRHIRRRHDSAAVANCQWCGRVTKDLDRHLQRNQCNVPKHERNKLPEVLCVFVNCGKKFKNDRDMKRHFEVVHDRKRPFGCGDCSYTASTRFNLQIHVKRVHERKPIKDTCPYCNKPCIGLDWHIRTYHAELATDLLKTSIDGATIAEYMDDADNKIMIFTE